MENVKQKDKSGVLVAIILISIGGIWLLQQLGINLHLYVIFRPVFDLFGKMWHFLFSWPMLLIFIGIILMAGKRPSGWIFIVLGSIFLIPRIFNFPDFSFSMIFPLVLILAGIGMILRRV